MKALNTTLNVVNEIDVRGRALLALILLRSLAMPDNA